MAVPMVALTVVVPAGLLVITSLVVSGHDSGRSFGRRLTRDRVHCSTQHHAQKQQQGCKALSATEGEPEKRHVGPISYAATFSHSLFARPTVQPALIPRMSALGR